MALVIPKNSWAPIISSSSPGDLSVTYARQNGFSAQSDALVLLGFWVQFTPTYTTAGGFIIISGFPEPPPDNGPWGGSVRFISPGVPFPTGTTSLSTAVVVGSATLPPYITILGAGASTNSAFLPITSFTSGTSYQIQANAAYAVGP